MEYKFERYHLDKLCEFRDKEIEANFMEFERRTNLNIVRFLSLLVGFIFAMFTLSDYYYYGSGDAFFLAVALRGAGLFITVVVFSIAGKFKRYNETLLLISFMELGLFAIYLLDLYLLKAADPAMQFMSVLLFILTIFLLPNRWKNCIIAGCIVWIAYIVYSVITEDGSLYPSITQRGIYLTICLLSCVIFCYGRGSSMRKQFAAEQLLEYMSITDRLTGIYNRNRFEVVLGQWIKNRRHDPFCLILFDIDNFKKVNDLYGHNAGDQVLAETTAVVSKNIRDNDIFARWGGEEFVILFGSTSIERAAELAERIRKAVENNPCGPAGTVTISIGVAQYRREESIPEFVNRADEHMYKAKKAGKNQVVAEIIPPEISPAGIIPAPEDSAGLLA